MYYDEKIEDGVLYYRSTPKGNWLTMDYDMLLKKYQEQKPKFCMAIRDFLSEMDGAGLTVTDDEYLDKLLESWGLTQSSTVSFQ